MQIRIDKLVYGGAGLGRSAEGKAVFVPYVLPGELVNVGIIQEKKGHMFAELLEVLEASPQRVLPFCKHFGECGGCAYQHMSYTDQLAAKKSIIQEMLERTCELANFPVKPILPSPQERYYRNQVQFHVSVDGKTGFLSAYSHELVAIEKCYLPEEDLLALHEALLLEDASGLERIQLRSGDADPLVYFHGEEAPELAVDFPVNLLFENEGIPQILSGDEFIIKTINERPFRVSADAFFQINAGQTECMLAEVLDALQPAAGGTLLDVYCGVGLFTAFAAPLFKEVIAIETAPLACEDFAANLDEFEHVSLYQGEAEHVLPNLKINVDAVVVDPPRAGIAPLALDALLALSAPRLVYVSCDLSTLARDLKRLMQGGYEVVSVQPLDMFPHTQHIECIVLLTKEQKRK
jgi:23S rRNA (uracil1939-C5)-methyltransferase